MTTFLIDQLRKDPMKIIVNLKGRSEAEIVRLYRHLNYNQWDYALDGNNGNSK